MQPYQISVDSSIYRYTPGFRLRYLILSGAVNCSDDPNLAGMLSSLQMEIAGIFGSGKAADDLIISSVRTMYKQWKIDPSRYRPSCERLIRRMLKGETIGSISAIVDICNVCSARYRLPVGLYDLAKLTFPVTFTICQEDTSYTGVTGTEIGAYNKPVLADSNGPAGSPTTDSMRTMITDDTTAFLLCVYAPESVSYEYIGKLLTEYKSLLRQFTEFSVDAEACIKSP